MDAEIHKRLHVLEFGAESKLLEELSGPSGICLGGEGEMNLNGFKSGLMAQQIKQKSCIAKDSGLILTSVAVYVEFTCESMSFFWVIQCPPTSQRCAVCP